MKTLRSGSSGGDVIHLQKMLNLAGYNIDINGKFDETTLAAVIGFQTEKGLGADGIVGRNTWAKIADIKKDFGLLQDMKQVPLSNFNYIPNSSRKNAIYIHHTAGRHRPDKTIAYWESTRSKKTGKPIRVATAYVIGGIGLDGDSSWDGKLCQCFPENEWAYHLGIKRSNNKQLNMESIGIEICNFGPLTKKGDDYISWAKTKMPKDQVYELDTPWRGFKYFHKYTAEQLETTKRLILNLAFLYDIPLANVKYDRNWFDINQDALNGKPGLWTHVNVRTDKTDCTPQPELIDMLNSLYEAQKSFIPEVSEGVVAERSVSIESMNFDPAEIADYARDLDEEGEE